MIPSQDLKAHLKEAEKTIEAYQKFAEATGAEITAIRNTKPLPKPEQGEDPQHRHNLTILSRIIKQVDEVSINLQAASEMWGKCLPSNAYQHNRVIYNLSLDLLAETLTGGRIPQSGKFGEVTADLGAKIAVTFGIGAKAPKGGSSKPPIVQESLDKLLGNKDFLDNPIGKILEIANERGNFSNSKEIGTTIWAIQDTMAKIKEPIQSLTTWIQKTTERIIGPSIPNAIQEEINLATGWLSNLDKPKVAALATGIAFTPTILAPLGTITLFALLAQKTYKEAKIWVERNPPKESELSKRADQMTQHHGTLFDPTRPYWQEKIQQELKEEGIQTLPPRPYRDKPPSQNILIIGENHNEKNENIEAYSKLIPELAKKGFKTLSIEYPQDGSKEIWDQIYEETKDIDDDEMFTQIGIITQSPWAGAYCLAKRQGMNVEFTDAKTKDKDRLKEAYTTCQQELPIGKEFNPEKITSVYGGPKEYLQFQKNVKDFAQSRDTGMAEKIKELLKKGPIVHIGGSAHNSNLQEELTRLTESRPLSLLIDYRSQPSPNLEEEPPNTEKIPAQEAGLWARNLPDLQIKKPTPRPLQKLQPMEMGMS